MRVVVAVAVPCCGPAEVALPEQIPIAREDYASSSAPENPVAIWSAGFGPPLTSTVLDSCTQVKRTTC